MKEKNNLKDDLKKFCRTLGVDDFGAVSAESLMNAGELHGRLQRILPGVKSVISFIQPFPKGALPLLKDAEAGFPFYTRLAGIGARRIDELSVSISIFLEEKCCLAVPIFVCTPLEMRDKFDMWGYASQIDLAAAAGVGWKGKNGLLISPKYGTRVGIGTILTDAALAPDSPLEEGCPEACFLCVEKCPSKALDGTGRVNRLTCTVTQATAPLSLMMAKQFPVKENMDMILNVGAVDEHTWYRCNACVVHCPVGT